MSGWKGSNRLAELPPDWPELRKQVIDRDKTCRWRIGQGKVCGKSGNQVDHIKRGGDHRPENLQLLCEPHHRTKSSREGGLAVWAYRRPAPRRDDVHPALR